MSFKRSEYLVSAEELAGKLGSRNLRLFDAAVHLRPNPKGGYAAVSGLDTYNEAHIPGAVFLDQMAQLSDTSNSLGFTRLADDQLIQAFADAGISEDSDVVLYSSGHTMWATRAWWLLHYCGHKRVAILDGGLLGWQNEGRECSTEAASYSTQSWSSTTLGHRFVDKAAVVSAVDDNTICTVNALSPAVYEGTGDHHYGRRGHIPNSINVYYDTLLDEGKFRSPEEVEQSLTDAGMLDDRNVIAYCGGGISATIDAFACLLVGKDDIAVYDGSMSEWVRDESLPLTEGNTP